MSIRSLQTLNAIKSTLAFTVIQMDGVQKVRCNSKASLCYQCSWNGQKSESYEAFTMVVDFQRSNYYDLPSL